MKNANKKTKDIIHKTLFVFLMLILPIFFIGIEFAYAGAAPGSLKWKFKTGDKIHISSPAIGSDGTVYVGSYDNYFYAINNNGTLKWKHKTGDEIWASPAIDSNGTIYIGSLDHYFYAFNSDGILKWKFETGDWIMSSPAIGSDGTVYIGSGDYYLYAINPDGTLKWQYETDDWISSPPVVGKDGTIYIGCWDNYLYAINPNGTLKWKYKTGDVIKSSPAIGSDGTIYVGSYDHYLYALNPNGTLKWKYETYSYIDSSPAIGSDGTIYVGSRFLYALNPDGTLKWKYGGTMSPGFQSSPAIGSDGTIYVGRWDRSLYALYDNGTLRWKYDTDGYILSSPAVDSDGTIYVGSDDHYLYAINSSSQGLANTPWPKFHYDNKNTGNISEIIFSDVPLDSWYYQYVKSLYDAGITNGCGNGKYCPNNYVTRAEMAAFIARAMGLSMPSCTDQPFTDIPEGSWFCSSVAAIKDAGITNGYSDGTYRPNNLVTRAEMAAFIARAKGFATSECDSLVFSDISIGAWYCKYVKAIKDANITNGCGNGKYCPNNYVTRAEMAAFIARAFLAG